MMNGMIHVSISQLHDVYTESTENVLLGDKVSGEKDSH